MKLCSFFLLLLGLSLVAQDTTVVAPPGDKRFGEEEQINKRREWFRQIRGLDEATNPNQSFRKAIKGAKADIAKQAMRGGAVWNSMGPSPMTMLNWAMGNVAGRVSAITVHPADVDTIYLGTASGGLWKTTDGGVNWTSIFDDVGTQTIGSVFIESNNPNNVWVGTGEHGTSCSNYFGLGLFKSTDGGLSWTEKNGSGANTLNASVINSVVVHPQNPNIVLAGGESYCDNGTWVNSGLYRSEDGGDNWTLIINGPVQDLIINPTTPNTMYVSIGNWSTSDNGVYRSTDAGASWTVLNSGLPAGTAASRTRIAMAPSDPNTLYCLMNNSGTRLYKTVDGGDNWTTQNTNACEGQCSYNLCLAVDPSDPSIVLVGTIRAHRSTNSGVTLTPLTTGWGSAQSVHQDTHVVRFDLGTSNRAPDGNTFWVGSDGGIWKTENAGATFNHLNDGLNITQYYDIAVHPDNPSIIFGGAQDNSSSRTTGDPLWEVTGVTGDGFMNLVDPSNPEIVYQTSYPSGGFPSLYRSSQGGAPNTLFGVSNTGLVGGDSWPWVVQLGIADLDDQTPTTLFIASQRVYRSTTDGAPWVDTSGTLGGSRVSILSPVVANGSMTVYAGKEDGSIHRTDDVLAASPNWETVTGNYPGGTVSGIAPDPTNPLRVFVTRSAFGGSKLYRSETGGSTWTAVGAGLPDVPANDAAMDPLNTDRIFVATDIGVYESTDGGDTFVPMMAGMPLGNVVTDLEIDDSPHVLTAGCYGRGAWQISLTAIPLSAGSGQDQAACVGVGAGLSVVPAGGQPPYTYSWSVLSGPDLSSNQFDNPAAAGPLFTPSTIGTYELQCNVADVSSSSVNTTVQVVAFDQASYLGAQMTGWNSTPGSAGWLVYLDANGNGIVELLDLILDMATPLCD